MAKLRDRLSNCDIFNGFLKQAPDALLDSQSQDVTVPDWQNYFIGLAFIASQRSKDANTKHGCVIVDEDNRILGTGYNSFPRGVMDKYLPNLRPQPGDLINKYDFMIHSEVNAVLNCIIPPRDAKNPTAYVTGTPCNNCLQTLAQAGVLNVVYADRKGWAKEDEKERIVKDIIVVHTQVKLTKVPYDLEWIKQIFEVK